MSNEFKGDMVIELTAKKTIDGKYKYFIPSNTRIYIKDEKDEGSVPHLSDYRQIGRVESFDLSMDMNSVNLKIEFPTDNFIQNPEYKKIHQDNKELLKDLSFNVETPKTETFSYNVNFEEDIKNVLKK